MRRFQNLLCFVDAAGKKHVALRRAVDLAERNGANLKIVDVVDDSELGMAWKYHADLFVQHRRERLQELAESARSRVPAATAELLHGRPAPELVREVLRHGFDLLLKDACGTSRHKTLLLGSVDMRLLRICPCPVWLDVPDHGRAHEVILAAIDPLASDPAQEGMNQAILELASSLAALESAEVHVIGAWEAEGESLLAGRVSPRQLRRYVSDVRAVAENHPRACPSPSSAGCRRSIGASPGWRSAACCPSRRNSGRAAPDRR